MPQNVNGLRIKGQVKVITTRHATDKVAIKLVRYLTARVRNFFLSRHQDGHTQPPGTDGTEPPGTDGTEVLRGVHFENLESFEDDDGEKHFLES